jgi:hypothetical protein
VYVLNSSFVELLRNVLMKDLCTFVNFMIIGIQFNCYNNSNCPLVTQNPRICTFHSFPLIMMVQCSALLN